MTTAAPAWLPASDGLTSDSPTSELPNASVDPVRKPAAAGERGATVIRPRVVERVVEQAVREVSDTAGTGRRVLGHTFGVPGTQTPATVRAYVDGPVATVDVDMAVIYPAPVLSVTRRARHHITDRIVALTGLSVRRIDITVVGMTVARPVTPRVR